MFAELVIASAAAASSDDAIVGRALHWLEPRVASADWSKTSPDHANDGGKRIVIDAVVAWLELARKDGHADEKLLATLDARIRSHLGDKSGVFGGFSNWTDGFAGLYCIERELHRRGGRDTLAEIARGFASRQNAEGGWDHGASFGLSFYPSTLIATSNLALVNLGFARRFGLDVDAEAVDHGIALLTDVQGTGGGMPYGGRPYTKGVEAGRTCGTVLALSALGLGADDRCARAGAYVLRNVDAIPDGHASTAFHLFLGALACSVLGPTASASFDETILARVRRAQRADGSFESIVSDSPDDMAIMTDTETNRAYITALSTAALLARSSKTAEALKLAKPAAPDAEPTAVPNTLHLAWHAPIAHAGIINIVGDRVFTLDDRGRARWLSLMDGKETGAFDLALGARIGDLGSIADEQGVLVWNAPGGNSGPILLGGAISGTPAAESGKTTLAFVPASRNEAAWSRALDGRVITVIRSGDRVIARTLGGRMHVLAQKNGAPLPEPPSSGVLPNAALGRAGTSSVVTAAESSLTCMDLGARPAAWTERWQRKNRARGLIPPAWTTVASGTDLLAAGRSNGDVVALRAQDGSSIWEAHTGSSIRRIAIDPTNDRAFALTHDGRLIAVDNGAIAWTCDVDRGRESHSEPALKLTARHAWVASPARNALICIDAKNGRIIGEQPWQADRPWSVRDDTLFAADEHGIDALQLH